MSRRASRDYKTLKTFSTIGIASLFQTVVLMTDITLKNLSTVALDSRRLMNASDFGKQCIIVVFDFCNMTPEVKHWG